MFNQIPLLLWKFYFESGKTDVKQICEQGKRLGLHKDPPKVSQDQSLELSPEHPKVPQDQGHELSGDDPELPKDKPEAPRRHALGLFLGWPENPADRKPNRETPLSVGWMYPYNRDRPGSSLADVGPSAPLDGLQDDLTPKLLLVPADASPLKPEDTPPATGLREWLRRMRLRWNS
ncbi:hypothetical protein CROQUDRAFT_652650 [Cronartium quercuum f. sp. fusiforme G11]|uniref:Uncharacterized protein n=1 Tax=Cronartium quercuum f. sp. fusiforme G11 TaxID=708437 RepID=A0A9P6NU19_9BASI|nr:hypothetical protein CROQUDRAFT_652650 [Cronartium quercuum f. sp. fusiforme G11]